MTMGEKILSLRKARGWSQEELADRVGVTRQAVSRWESGQAKPDADKIIAICDLFGVSADYLLRDISGRAEPSEEKLPPDSGFTARQLVGSVLLLVGVIALLALTALGVERLMSLLDFTRVYELDWLLFLTVLCIAAGAWFLLGPMVKHWFATSDFWSDLRTMFGPEE